MIKRPHFDYTGVIPILATPFHDDESLDLDSLARSIQFNKQVGVDGVTVLGLLGESNRLTDAERAAVVSAAVEAAGKLPVIVGTSHTGTTATIALSEQAMSLGAAALMITPSAQPVASDRSVFEYFERVAKATDAPIVLQDHPAISQVHMSVDLMLRMVRELPHIAAIKGEAVPSPAKIGALKKGMQGGRSVPVLTGLGGLYGLFDLERGSDGFNTGFAFPEVLMAILNAFKGGDAERARAVYTRYLPLFVYEQQPGVAIRKEILRRRGLLQSARVRHPGATIDEANGRQLSALLEAVFGGVAIDRPLAVA
jgi:4-hydroxy-tetrahydrodipicolinate synthase